MILVLLLQMIAVLVGVDWSAGAARPQITRPLVALAPLGFIGLLTCLIGSRLETLQQRTTPLRVLVCVLSTLLAIGMLVTVPMPSHKDTGEASNAQNLEQGRAAVKDARAFRKDPKKVALLGEQLAQAGQLTVEATAEDKQRAAETMIDEQIAQMEAQITQVESQQTREYRQRLIGVTTTAIVLAIAFVLLALTAVI
ncbi:HpsJ family protein [Synechococcus sp. M16CYN]